LVFLFTRQTLAKIESLHLLKEGHEIETAMESLLMNFRVIVIDNKSISTINRLRLRSNRKQGKNTIKKVDFETDKMITSLEKTIENMMLTTTP